MTGRLVPLLVNRSILVANFLFNSLIILISRRVLLVDPPDVLNFSQELLRRLVLLFVILEQTIVERVLEDVVIDLERLFLIHRLV